MSEHSITHVSDTALMTAGCRALETERPDGWICDPLAARVAGERGLAIIRALPGMQVMCFGVGMRSRILDVLLVEEIPARGVRTVLSAGAGLDTRPWRITLPPSLRWIEADLGPILEYKREALAGTEPNCRVEQMVVDLVDADARARLFGEPAEGPSMLITEGLLMYLPGAVIEAIATEAAAAGIRYWLLDVSTSAMSAATRMREYKDIQAMRAVDHLEGEDILEAATRAGWRDIASRTYARDGMKLVPPARLEAIVKARAAAKPGELPPPPPPTDPSGVHLFEFNPSGSRSS